MAHHDIDMTADSDDDEIEVVIVERPAAVIVDMTQLDTTTTAAIDLTDPNVEVRNNTGREKNNRASIEVNSRSACTNVNVQRKTAIIDLYNYSDDDDATAVSSKKPPATPKAPFRSTECCDDVVIVESPRNARKIIKASPQITPRGIDSSMKKRAHSEVAASASGVIDLTDLVDEDRKRQRRQISPRTLHDTYQIPSKAHHQQPARPSKQKIGRAHV